MSQTRIERRIRLAAALVLISLLLSVVSMLWNHPLSFASLHMLALLLFIAGCAIYLLALLPHDAARNPSDREHPQP
jgi:heme A synthase